MSRLLFEKTGNSVWISHLDLMRVFQRSFKRAGLPLTHSKGFNPRPSVSIALPLSVGIESHCELLDFDLEGQSVLCDEICSRLNNALIDGVKVLKVYDDGAKIKNLAFLACELSLEYDAGVPENAAECIRELFSRQELPVEKKSKNGVVQQDIIPMIRSMHVGVMDSNTVRLEAVICCQNPSLNPMQLNAAIEAYMPGLKADYVRCSRIEVYDGQGNIFR